MDLVPSLVLCVLFTANIFKFQKILKSLAKASGVLCQRRHKRNDPLAGEVDYLNPPSIQQVLVVPKVIENTYRSINYTA